eukprot:Hpha_TRINITY_DN9640_c0_g1::TRINITY_DN9640_c0_g1_i1::g.184265::m.184265
MDMSLLPHRVAVGTAAVAAVCCCLRRKAPQKEAPQKEAPQKKPQKAKSQDHSDADLLTKDDYNDLSLAAVDTTTIPERFAPGDPAAFKYLQRHGYVVLRGALDPGELKRGEELLWEKLKEHGMQPGQPETWEKPNYPCNPANGIVSRDFGQSDFMWHLRGAPGVIKAFSGIWGTEDLITSFDGCNVMRPWDDRPEWRTMGGWWHVDQGKPKRGFQSVQGLVTLYDVDATTGGLVVMPGTQLHHDELIDRQQKKTSGDFLPIGVDPLLETQALLVQMKAGDLALWDSRTIHCNFPGTGPAKNPKELIRAVGYVCMAPKKQADKETLEDRKDAFAQRQSTTHWPQECRTTSRAINDVPPKSLDDLTPAQRRLVA